MRDQLIEHILSIFFIAILFTGIIYYLNIDKEKDLSNDFSVKLDDTFKIENFDYDNPLQIALLKETLNIFYSPFQADSIFSLYALEFKKESNTTRQYKEEINSENIFQILLMFLKFIFVYVFVLAFTYYGVQTLAVYRFVSKKQKKLPLLIGVYHQLCELKNTSDIKKITTFVLNSFLIFLKAIAKTIFYLILFSPAYVIAYSFKTKFDTDSIIFMVILGVISNALLITYAQKFYTFLVTEGNRGYVETAIVKNLKNDYSFQILLPGNILNLKKDFKGHVLNHIFMNAKRQYYSTIKEQAAFLITGLIIIEMALNIHGHLSYELMQNLLYQKYQLVVIIVFLIFLTVKATEILVDIFIYKANRKYENK